jgi:ribose 5-phosphate isomerase B
MSPISEKELQELVQKIVLRTMGNKENAGLRPASTTADTEAEVKPITRRIAIASDHGGFKMKEALKPYLQEQGYQVDDCGTHSTEAVDYPDFALVVAKKVSEGEAWRGIIIDGAGIGSCMVANKVHGVRAAMCYSLPTAVNSREHNDANVLTLGAGMIDQTLAQQIIITWLNTVFGGGRHAKRVDKIIALDQKIAK